MFHDKKYIEDLYSKKSLRQLSEILGMSIYGVTKLLKTLEIPIRNKSQAQSLNLSLGGQHPTKGKKLSKETKDKISRSTEKFWQSKNGTKAKQIISDTRKEEWENKTVSQQRTALYDLNHGERSSLSRFGDLFYKFLIGKNCDVKKRITINRVIFDILINNTIIEFVGSMSSNQEYLDKKINSAISGGCDILIVVQTNSSLSQARCRRLFEEYEIFVKSKMKSKVIDI